MSQTENVDTEESISYQLGVNELDMSGSIADDEDVMEFNYEATAIFKRLADDIYESPEAGTREPLTNSITTSRRVIRDGKCDNPVIEITVHDGEQKKLRLRDMGEGISKSLLEDVLLYIGRSTARDDGELSGQYGMGFLASYKLVGMDGGFIMYTNPRDSPEGPYRGLFKPGAFEPDNEGKIPPLLDDDEYGTVFEYFVKSDITIDNIRDWVDTHARYSPIPIIYSEMDADGNEVYNEEYYAPTLKQSYGENTPSIHVDTPYYEATTSPDANNDIVLISSPVNMYGTSALRRGLPWSVDLRLKYENGIVVDGPHEGLIPTTEKQYNMLDEERKEDYVSEENLTDDDLTLPEATGTRERVRRHKSFLQHVNSELRTLFIDIVHDTLDSFNPQTQDMEKLTEMQKNVFMRIFSHFDDDRKEYTTDNVENKLDSNYDYENPSETLVEFILAMTQNVSVISERKTRKSRYPRKPAYKIAKDYSDIYMCVASNSWKTDAVEISEKSTSLVKVSKASDYEMFENHLGWTPLKEVKKSNAGELFDLDEEQINKLTTRHKTTSKNVNDKDLTIHYQSGGRNTLKRTSDSLIDTYDKSMRVGQASSRYGDVLVLFPQTSEYKVSNHYELADNRCCVANVTSKKLATHLTGNSERILTYEEYLEWVSEQEIKTSSGIKTIGEIFNQDNSKSEFVLTPKSNPDSEIMNDTTILSAMSEQLNSRYDSNENEVIYGIVNKYLLEHIESVFDTSSVNLLVTSHNYRSNNSYKSKKHANEVEMYAKCCFTDEQYDSTEVSLVTRFDKLNKTVVNIIDNLTKSYGITGSFSSETNTVENNIRMPIVKTKFGELSFDKIDNYTEYNNVILHVVEDTESLSLFEQDCIINNAGKHINKIEKLDIKATKSVYVPMLLSEYQRVSEYIPDDVEVISSQYNSSVNYSIYVHTQIPNWADSKLIDKLKYVNNFAEFTEMVDTLVPVHNTGVKINLEEYSADEVAKTLI